MKAVSILSLVTLLFLAGCSKSASDLNTEAQEAIKNDNPAQAVTNYETIINEHPESDLAPIALFELGRMYQGRLVEDVQAGQSFHKAVSYFLRMANEYPDHDKAPLSLFMVGFIQANELLEYEMATANYKRFIEKYPQHELAESARDELQMMGQSPEEVLRKKMATEDASTE